MVDGGDAEFDRVEILVGEIDAGQHALQQGRLLGRHARAPIGETLAAGIGLGKFVLVLPAAVFDQVVDVRAVGAFGVAEHAQCGRLHIAAGFGLMRQHMLAHEIHLDRLVGGGGHERGFGQKLDLQGQQVAEDPGQRRDARRCAAGQVLRAVSG